MIQILTHRGLEPSKENFYSESSLQAFHDQLQRGFGLEVDLNFTKDGIVLCHDADLKRMTKGTDARLLKNLTTAEASAVALPNGRLATFEELMDALRKHPKAMIALHFKGPLQKKENIEVFINRMQPYENLFSQVIVFDLTASAAKQLKQKMPQLQLAASVAHPFDIERYQNSVKGTLMPMEDLLKRPELFSWAWLDEWDLMDRRPDGSLKRRGKKLYTKEVFNSLRNNNFKIALVTPELHGTSPGLLGSEAHPHAASKEKLFARMKEIVSLQPDAICTDYPEELRQMTPYIKPLV